MYIIGRKHLFENKKIKLLLLEQERATRRTEREQEKREERKKKTSPPPIYHTPYKIGTTYLYIYPYIYTPT